MWAWLGALLVLAWVAARVGVGHRSAPGRLLSRGEMSFLDAAAEAVFPAGGEIPQSGLQAGISEYMDTLVAAQEPRQRWLMRALFVLLEHATLLFPPLRAGGLTGLRRFSSLDVPQRIAYLEGWRTSRLFQRRLCFTSLRTLITLAYCAHPPVLRALHLAPFAIESPVCEADLLYPRIGESRSSIALGREDLTAPAAPAALALDDPPMQSFEEEVE